MSDKYTIGTVSYGTMRSEDLIPEFVDELECLCKAQDCLDEDMQQVIDEGRAIIKYAEYNEDVWEFENTNEYLNETLWDALNNCAPPYFYFGSHEGDGSDFGFWLCPDAIEDFDGLKVSDTSEVPENYEGEVMHINDHGNVSLYVAKPGQELEEIWAIV